MKLPGDGVKICCFCTFGTVYEVEIDLFSSDEVHFRVIINLLQGITRENENDEKKVNSNRSESLPQ